ncbi:hypothetical protein DFO77_10213 [Marinilabilia salmonicolor]|uniref:Uncharacterized protein n=2 Tax=Marinilabilia salmonicolor TaxID=989 RepID=A0A368VCD7_9BACT|nr:hypothetical protein DFO77_10213 [Marinilabilia salmonicolor]
MITNGNNIGKFFGLLILGFILMAVFGIFLQKKRMERYPMVTYQSELKGEISEIRINRGTLAEFKNGQKFSLPSSDNLSYTPYFIGRFINRGDSLVKSAFSDSIFIYRNKKKYYFILGKRVEK